MTNILLSLITSVLLLLLFNYPESGVVKNYQCSKCSTLVKSERLPSTLNCRTGGSHQWYYLGEVGQENYNCKKCRTLLESKRIPSTLGCPTKESLQWNHLGHVGNTTYQCKKMWHYYQ